VNARKKTLLTETLFVLAITIVAVVGMVNLKDYINRSEAIRAMRQLGEKVLLYRKANGSLPPESYVTDIKETLEGYVRLGKVQYRALWIDFQAGPDEILAYTFKKYRSMILSNGYIVLRLDGRVEWMPKEQFEKLLAQQQSQAEVQIERQ
jgi:hypothetical protein